MQLVFEQVRMGGDRNFGYLLGDREAKVAVIVDPAYSPALLVERAEAQDSRITHVINTHGHPDHIKGNLYALPAKGQVVLTRSGTTGTLGWIGLPEKRSKGRVNYDPRS